MTDRIENLFFFSFWSGVIYAIKDIHHAFDTMHINEDIVDIIINLCAIFAVNVYEIEMQLNGIENVHIQTNQNVQNHQKIHQISINLLKIYSP